MPAYFHCRTCGTQVALVQDYDHSVDDLVNAKFFTEVLNVEVTEDERYHPVTDGMNLAETYCVQCKTLLGWKLVESGGIFNRVFNVEVSDDVNNHETLNGSTIANANCVQCGTMLGWKFVRY
ncbi:hypothetical protein MTR67_029250 [Solanum verrucosum]|uniref:Yippee domain-containing protein n=1 Tax=Solanum verrucosum TaxID=315347 RepID=A0AAF0RAT0_SOLVR|nr:hypothetical protein MTR67_029250 [Solanum verrucosum]